MAESYEYNVMVSAQQFWQMDSEVMRKERLSEILHELIDISWFVEITVSDLLVHSPLTHQDKEIGEKGLDISSPSVVPLLIERLMRLLAWISLLLVISTGDVERIVVYGYHEVLQEYLSMNHSNLFVLLQSLDGIKCPSGDEDIDVDLVHLQSSLLLMNDLGHCSARAMEKQPQFLLGLQHDLWQQKAGLILASGLNQIPDA